MKTFKLLILQMLLAIVATFAQEATPTQGDAQDLSTKVVNSFMEYYKFGIDEKLYIQTDKPYYSAGESIWFKGYLVNAITHRPLDLSNYIYVELTDSKGERISHIKVKRDSLSGFNGYIKLEPKMDPGDYSIRAYTKWMSGSDEDFFFEKTIEIVSPISEDSMAGQAQSATAEPTTNKEKREAAKAEAKSGEKLKYDLQFFPEGGALIAGVSQKIAFKAVAEDGFSIEVRGQIYNSANEQVAEFESVHKGMGSVQLTIPEGEQFYAKAISSEGIEVQSQLPLASSTEVSLMVSHVGSNVYYQALASDPNAIAGLSAVIHSRGRIITVDSGNLTTPRKLPLNMVYDGISVISLMTQTGDVVAERIFFKKPVALPSIEITPNSSSYKARTKATISLKAKDSAGNPAQGQFAVSVTDDNAIGQDSTSNNALSYLLLSSEIKGYIESPGLYFVDNSRITDHKLDLLLMTQGWRRFDLEKIIDPTVDHRREFQYEDVVQINGEVNGFFGNAARSPKLSFLCQRLGVIDAIELDSSNKFSLIDVDIPDSAVYVFQAQGRNGGNRLTLKIPDEVLPEPKAAIFPRIKEVVPFQFINQSQEKFYFEGGLSLIELESVVVTTQAVSKVEHSGFATRSTEREELQSMGGVTLDNIIATYMGIVVDGDEVTYRGGSVTFRVDGMEYEYSDLSLLTTDLVEQIDFFDSTSSTGLFSGMSGNIFNITLMDGASIPTLRLPNIVNYAPLGYQRVEKFYAPAYDTPSKKSNLPPDFRTTIFWSGDITPDAEGNMSFEFYTADRATRYRITVEGVTNAGEICHSETTVIRE
ncbi:MAG: MG2 domain-containing protein [Rikenellaceae bacterium]